MKLIGMLDSPYVRRVAISLQLLGLRFEHEALSVFRNFDDFRRVNPIVKAPTLVCDDGGILMDSTLILEYAECLAAPGRSLMPRDVGGRQRALRTIGVALAACEKSVQIVYELNLRPAEKQHAPWLERVTGQLHAAFGLLESDLARAPANRAAIDQATLTTAVAWQFTRLALPQVAGAMPCPALRALSEWAESLPEFRAAPYGDGTYRAP
ncbi:MAG TPA: glutathione S-transferase [Burkholderiaceae bacterium]|nr:glutathione S-transferase [Burkholderiaceae bacterium]